MTAFFSTEAALLQLTPIQVPLFLGRVKRSRNVIDMASTSQGPIKNGDTISLLPLPIGSVFALGVLSGPTLGSSTLAISDGTNTYLAAATYTSAVPAFFGAQGPAALDPSTAVLTPVVTVGAADMPTSGKLVIDMYYSQAT